MKIIVWCEYMEVHYNSQKCADSLSAERLCIDQSLDEPSRESCGSNALDFQWH